MNSDQTAPKEQSDMGPYCLHDILPKYTYADKLADKNCREWWGKKFKNNQ